jgi:hypothetical protein
MILTLEEPSDATLLTTNDASTTWQFDEVIYYKTKESVDNVVPIALKVHVEYL